MIKAETLIERLYQHEKDFKEGNPQDLAKICNDCKLAADMIAVLKSSKHTQKRRRQRLSKKNREKNQKIERLNAEIEQLKTVNNVEE